MQYLEEHGRGFRRRPHRRAACRGRHHLRSERGRSPRAAGSRHGLRGVRSGPAGAGGGRQRGRGHRRDGGQALRHRARHARRPRVSRGSSGTASSWPRSWWSTRSATCATPSRAGSSRERGMRPTARRLVDSAAALEAGATPPDFRPVNTTIGVIATTAALGKAEAARVARAGLEGFERALSPPHLPTDGDALFCLSVGDARADLDSLGRGGRRSRRDGHRAGRALARRRCPGCRRPETSSAGIVERARARPRDRIRDWRSL